MIVQLNSPTRMFGPAEWLLRPIAQCRLSDQADVAFGAAASATNAAGQQPTLVLDTVFSGATAGGDGGDVALPNHAVLDEGKRFRFAPNTYGGHIE
jgi:hypothetical protein